MANETSTMQEEHVAAEIARETKQAMTRRRGKMSGKYKALLIITSLLMMGVLRTGFIFVIIAMLPAVVAYYIDITAERHRFKTIFACNLCGVLPYIEKMLYAGPSSAVLQSIMGNVTNWMLIFGSALVGWLLSELCPMVAQVLVASMHQAQISRIERMQKKIESEWGPEVMQFSKSFEDDE